MFYTKGQLFANFPSPLSSAWHLIPYCLVIVIFCYMPNCLRPESLHREEVLPSTQSSSFCWQTHIHFWSLNSRLASWVDFWVPIMELVILCVLSITYNLLLLYPCVVTHNLLLLHAFTTPPNVPLLCALPLMHSLPLLGTTMQMSILGSYVFCLQLICKLFEVFHFCFPSAWHKGGLRKG